MQGYLRKGGLQPKVCPPSKTHYTKIDIGLSFKVPVRRRDLNCIFMDTAGHGAPLRQKEIASMNATPPTETPGNTPTGPVDGIT